METADQPYAQAPASAGPARKNNKFIRWTLWGAALLVMSLLCILLIGYLILSLGAAPVLMGMVMATIPVPLYLTLALWLDRYEKEPAWMLAWAFFWGASVAVFFSFVLNTMGSIVVLGAFGSTAATLYGPVISAPVVEEGSKALALFILFWWKKDEFDNVIDGIIYAAMVGLGFAMIENVLYYGRSLLEGGFGGGLQTFVIRGVLDPFAHPLFTSATGIGLGLARQSSRTLVRFAAPAAGLLLAIALHSFSNLANFIPAFVSMSLVTFLALAFVFITVPMVTILSVVVFFGLRREGRIVRRFLTPELQGGLITRREYEALGSVRGRMVSSLRALRRGFGPWRAHSRFAQAATELAFHRDRVQRGVTSVETASRETAYVQALRGLRGQQVA